jgi:hypothetical protein
MGCIGERSVEDNGSGSLDLNELFRGELLHDVVNRRRIDPQKLHFFLDLQYSKGIENNNDNILTLSLLPSDLFFFVFNSTRKEYDPRHRKPRYPR